MPSSKNISQKTPKRPNKRFVQKREVGGLKITLPKQPEHELILNYQYPQKEQKFSIIQDEILDKVKRINTLGLDELQNFRHREMDRRREGVHFYNNGKIEYVTGLHYFYLCYWKFPVKKHGWKRKKMGLPDWIDADRDHFYFWDICNKDDDCYGMIEITNRRSGKTFRALCTAYEVITRSPDSWAAIQSKTTGDGKKCFNKLVKSWQRLPNFLKPIDSGETHPTTALKFQEPGTRSSKGDKKEYTEVLGSEINYGSSKEEEYDGDGILFYFGDEIGKTVDSDVYERWLVIKECLSDGSEITGKALLTTTVEEMERKGGKNCKLIWDGSDANKKNEINQTESGLYKYFKPAYYGLRGGDKEIKKDFIDEWGYSQIKEARAYLEKKRKGKGGSALSSEKRKYPFEESECFIIDNAMSPLDTDRLYAQIEHNSGLPASKVIRGNFVWKVRDEEAMFVPSKEGFWLVVWMPQEKDRNQFTLTKNKKAPANRHISCSGTDPYDHKTVAGKKKSNAASVVRVKFDPMNPYDSKLFACLYVARRPTPELFYEDMIIQSFFYGHEMLVETNKPGICNYFRTRGYFKYLMRRPEPTHTAFSKKNQTEPGIPMSGDAARGALIGALETEVYNNVGWIEKEEMYAKCYINELCLDLIEFEADNWTKYDITVATGLSLLGERKFVAHKELDDSQKIQNFVREYSYRGNRAKLVDPNKRPGDIWLDD